MAVAKVMKRDSEKMIDRVNRDEDDEVKPEEPAGHRKERKKILPKEEEIIKRGLELLERLRKEENNKTPATQVSELQLQHAGKRLDKDDEDDEESFATFGEDDVYDQKHAEGFIRLYSLASRIRALNTK